MLIYGRSTRLRVRLCDLPKITRISSVARNTCVFVCCVVEYINNPNVIIHHRNDLFWDVLLLQSRIYSYDVHMNRSMIVFLSMKGVFRSSNSSSTVVLTHNNYRTLVFSRHLKRQTPPTFGVDFGCYSDVVPGVG